MHIPTGQILDHPEMEQRIKEGKAKMEDFIQFDRPLTGRQKRTGKVGRNELCPCGSGKKYKNCHMRRTSRR